jgi:hypothetical protein
MLALVAMARGVPVATVALFAGPHSSLPPRVWSDELSPMFSPAEC